MSSLTHGAMVLARFGGQPEIHERGIHIEMWPAPSDQHRSALERVVSSGRYHRVNHPIVLELEEAFSRWSGFRVRAVGSGTAAIHIALESLDREHINVGVAALNWPGALGPIHFSGRTPVFLDVSLEDACVLPENPNGAPVETLLVTHLFGNYAREADAWATSTGAHAIHDCAQAIGAVRHILSDQLAIAVSGNGAKHLGAGELGLLFSKDERVRDQVDTVSLATSSRNGERYFQPNTMGYNYRPNVFSAAIALSRLDSLAQDLAVRVANARRLADGIAHLPGVRPLFRVDDDVNSFNVVPFRLELGELDLPESGAVRDRLVELLIAEGVPAGVWLRDPVWSLMRYSTNADLDQFPNTKKLLATMFHVGGIEPPNGFEQVDAFIAAFQKVWAHLDLVQPWLMTGEA